MGSLTKEEIASKGLCIDDGLCTMCGICVGVCPTSNIQIVYRNNEPELSFGDKCNDCGICYQVCPGKVVPLRDLDKFIFGKERDPEKDVFGIFETCYQANAIDPETRGRGASGGVVSALLIYALERKLISLATVVQFDEEHPWQARPTVARTREEVLKGAGSIYHVMPKNAALADPSVRRSSLTIGHAGLPCQVHGLRKLQYHYPSHPISKRTAFTLGIHCGGTGSGPFRCVEYFLKEYCGIESLDEIKSLRYRSSKDPQDMEVVKRNGEVIVTHKHATGRIFRRERCSLCYDWGADLSDVSVGDFWGPAANGSKANLGSSTIFVRTKSGRELVDGAVKAGYLELYPTPLGPLALHIGFRNKKYGNINKLLDFKRYGWPAPDYQYPIVMLPPFPRRGAPYSYSVLSIEERERLLAKRGTDALWYD